MFTNRLKWYTLTGVLLLPLVFAAGFLAATWNMNDRLGNVQAAIVNHDEAVTVNGQLVPLGRQLTASLVDSNREQNFDWVMASEEDARDGLNDGTYAAVVTIPENFSAAATSASTASSGGAAAQQATIGIETSPTGGIAESALGQSIAKEAVSTLNTTLTESFLDQIFLGFSTMGSQFSDLSTGTQQLADGASSLSDGVGDAAKGSATLTVGLNTLANSSNQLNSGAAQSAQGANQLASGLNQLESKTSTLPSQTQQLATGVSGYVDGVNQLIDQTQAQSKQMTSTLSGLGQVSDLSTGASGVYSGLQEYQANLRAASGGGSQTATRASSASLPECPYQSVQANQDRDEEKPTTDLCQVFYAGVAEGLNSAADGLDQGKEGGILAGAQRVAAGTSALNKAVSQIDVPTTAEMEKANAQLAQLKTAGSSLKSGTSQLAQGTTALTQGISQVSTGADQLATGLGSLSTGVKQYTDGVGQAADGSRQLTTGLEQAAEGASKLSDGTDTLASGVKQGATQIPSYTPTERQNLSEAMANPVSNDNLLGLPAPSVAWGSLVVVVALWFGAVALYTVAPAIRVGAAMSTASSSRVLVESLAPGVIVGVVQAALMTAVASVFNVPSGASLFGVMLLASIAFITVNYALTSLFGNAGRWISVAFVVITAATTLTSALPGWLQVLKPLSPVSAGLDTVRAVMTDQSFVSPALSLTAWLLAGLAGCAVAVIRSRKVPLMEVMKVR